MQIKHTTKRIDCTNLLSNGEKNIEFNLPTDLSKEIIIRRLRGLHQAISTLTDCIVLEAGKGTAIIQDDEFDYQIKWNNRLHNYSILLKLADYI